jgi:immune inhibitor A
MILVMVDFVDQPMNPGAKKGVTDLFFSTGVVNPSVKEYYADVSNGIVSLTGTVVGPFRMPLKMADYGKNDNGWGDQPNGQTLALDALNAAKATVDFSQYAITDTTTGKRVVPGFVVVHAGGGAESTTSTSGVPTGIWSMKWVLPSGLQVVNGVTVYPFACVPEMCRVGVIAHKLGHLLFGWPDLYGLPKKNHGAGLWGLMGQGTWGGNPGGTAPTHP